MKLSKRIISIISLVVVFCVIFSINTFAFTQYPADSWFVRGSLDYHPDGDIPALGTISVHRDVYNKELNIYPGDDGVELITDSYGVRGFRWYFASANLTIPSMGNYTGDYELTVFVPWTNSTGNTYFGYHTNNEYYRIQNLDLWFSCSISYTENGVLKPYLTQNNTATLYEGDTFNEQSVIGSNTYLDNDASNYGAYHIKSSNVLGLSKPQNLNLSIKWKGKPSGTVNSYIEFSFARTSVMYGSYLRDYLNDLNNAARDEFDRLKDELRVPVAAIDGNLDSSDFKQFALFMREDSEFYEFSIILVGLSLSVGALVYVLHGKKR